MNCYTDERGDKFYVKEKIDFNYKYILIIHNNEFYLESFDRSIKYKIHRENMPAVEWHNGDKEYLINGKYHREDGPACEYLDGPNYWFYHGEPIHCKNNEEFLKIIKMKAFL